eukprot:COSAG05_NODE_289_length_12065_cov_9.271519_9_plen_99_part_00
MQAPSSPEERFWVSWLLIQHANAVVEGRLVHAELEAARGAVQERGALDDLRRLPGGGISSWLRRLGCLAFQGVQNLWRRVQKRRVSSSGRARGRMKRS